MIAENLKYVNERIQKSCLKAGRDEKEVTLIAVSKTKPVPDLMEAYQEGCREFGENKVQELVDKYEVMPKDRSTEETGYRFYSDRSECSRGRIQVRCKHGGS